MRVGGMPLHGSVHVSTRDFYCRKEPAASSSPRALKNGAEELLLPEGVFRGRHWDDEGVLPHVGFTVGQEVRGCLGDLWGHSTGAWLKAFTKWVQAEVHRKSGHGQSQAEWRARSNNAKGRWV